MRIDASRLASVAPDDPGSHRQLANALLATQAPQPSVALALERTVSLRPRAQQAVLMFEVQARQAFAIGDFKAAEKQLEGWRQATRQHVDQYDSAEPAILQLRLYEEQGRYGAAANVAKDYLDHMASRGEPSGGNLSIHFQLPLARDGKLQPQALQRKRDAWLIGYRKKWRDAGRKTETEFDWIAWSSIWGSVRDASEARRAVAAMPTQMPSTIEGGRWAVMDLNIGRAFVLAGEPSRALAYLERAARSCERLDEPHLHPIANAFLGVALADLRRPKEAIAPLERVLNAWRDAPGSKTAAMARDRLQALRAEESPE